MNASQRVEFDSLFSVRKKNYFASKRGGGVGGGQERKQGVSLAAAYA